ncbi:MAG: ribonuclease HIII [Victivallales bacterium]|nr:ribonuclease HIII [Victivallales bacterium]
MAGSKTNYVCTLTKAQAEQLHGLMEERGWEFDAAPYAYWRGKKDKTNVVAYESGKLTVQGAGTADFVQFLLEPEVLKEARFGYETELAVVENPAMFLPHAGIDESGKGDFFGPLVVACCYTEGDMARHLLQAGVADSKTIKTERKIFELADLIRKEAAGRFNLIVLMPETYNRLYASIGNLNRLLAWGHAKTLENVLEKVPNCPRAISDQFAQSATTVQRALQSRGRQIQLEQHPKAEADVAVAAASILARAEFVQRMKALGEQAGMPLPKGASAEVLKTAKQLVQQLGAEALPKFAKMHFKTAAEVLGIKEEEDHASA